MKKFSALMVFLLAIISVAFAGKDASRNYALLESNGQPFGKHAQPQSFYVANIIYSEDFGSGIPGNWQLIDNAGNGVNWKRTTSGIFNAALYPTAINRLNQNGTSAVNGYMLYDSDSSGQTVQGEDADMVTGAIDCSGNSTVRLSFNQFLYHFYETATVSISNDGTSWTQVLDASSLLTTNTYTQNPDQVDLDISALAANQATVYIKFNFTGDYDYWWMIDDVKLYEPVNYTDVSITSILNPVSNCTGLSNNETVTAIIKNEGTTAISSADISYSVDGSPAITESSSFSLAAGDSLSYSFSTPADFSIAGPHSLTLYISSPSDTNQSNDTITASVYTGSRIIDGTTNYSNGFEINDDLSGWDTEDFNNDATTWTINSLLPRSGNFCANYSAASASQFANDWLFSPCFDLNDSTVYQLDYYFRTFNSATDAYIEIALCNAQSSAALAAPIQLPALITSINYQLSNNQFTAPSNGTFYIGFHVLSGTKTASLRIDDINLSVSTGVGITKPEEYSLVVYPNPASDQLVISGGKGSNYRLQLFNMLGESVIDQKAAELNQESINVSGLAPGLYMLTLTNSSSRTMRSVVIE
ncbi:MAG: hypothetical protein RIQ47_1104 [Bacteroidota bacterium]